MKRYLSFFLLLLLLCALSPREVPAQNFVSISPTESSPEIIGKAAHVCPAERQAAWQELEFTVFIHFGMNTFTNREWGEKGTPASLFNPTRLNAGQWVKTAKMAGARLLIMVAKHHDGFCLWPSKYTDYTIKNSPWKRGRGDVIAEVAAACQKFGMKLGVYLSPWDINSPLYGTPEYNAHFISQLTELLTNYGPVDEVWFDGACGEGANGKRQVYDWQGYYKTIRKLQPKAVIAIMGPDVRWVGTESGYGRETEWSVVPIELSSTDSIAAHSQQSGMKDGTFLPPGNMMENDLGSREKILKAKTLIWYPSEVDVSIRPGWFYHSDQDSLVKSPEQLVDIWYSSVGRNSVLLLNLPPDRRGLIHENDSASLAGMKRILDATFSNNLTENALTHKTDTTIQLDMPHPVLFDRAMIQENFRNGQRVEAFVLEAKDGSTWKEIIRGTTIGYKRLLRFTQVKSSRIRLRILSARDVPEIKTFGLFKTP
ncbi:MAG: alpha-L-fucosidase [bacterium]